MTSAAVTPSPSRDVIRDPVLVLPLVVGAGLAVGWLGVDEHVPGTRVAAGLALSWALAAASVIVLEERPRWRRARWMLVAAAFAVLGADLEWASSHAFWTLGFVLQGVWTALLAQLVLTFPEGRPWARAAGVVIVGAYAVTLGGQLIGAFVAPDARDALSVATHPDVAQTVDRAQEVAGIGLALAVLFLVLQRARVLRGPASRTHGPLLLAAAVTALAGLVCLGWAIATGVRVTTLETVVRAVTITIPLGIVGGIVWARLRRSEASELVVELQTEAASMRERLAQAVGDPTLELAYRLGDGRYVDAAGRPVELPHGSDRAVTGVTAGGEEIAVLVHDPALLDEPALVESVRATAALVLENERLAAEVRSQLAEVRASRGRIVAAADAERRRIERNLHDGAQQRLVTLSVALGLEASRAGAASADVLSRAQDDVEQAIAELRDLARGIHPTLLRDEGLEAAVRALAWRTPLPVTLETTVRDRLSDRVELAAYFVVSEALTNVVKHASASEAWVLLEREPATLRVSVRDDGVGGACIRADSGLAGLHDRLEALDATLSITSEAGQGSTVCAVFPCAS